MGFMHKLDDLPIVIPNKAESAAITAIVDEITAGQKAALQGFDYRPKLVAL